MSSTNKTTNYELSQFIGTDKPAWLQDYNTDMTKIDTGIHTAQTTATGADGKADANATNIGVLTNLTTTEKTSLVGAINEVNATSITAQNTATASANVANTAKTEADAVAGYLSITQNGQITPTLTGGTLSPTLNYLYYALNNAGTLGKIYGRVRFTATGSNATLTLPISAINTSTQFTIGSACFYTVIQGSSFYVINARDMIVNPNGNCTISFTNLSVGDTVTVWLPPCLYFFTDFGDVINPE